MSELPDTIRAFVALRMDAPTTEAVARLTESLRKHGSRVRWVRPANLHLTLRFLGGRMESRLIAPLDRELAGIATRTPPFTLELRGTGAFPNLARPRVVWVGLRGRELPELAAQVEAAAVRCGLPAKARPYSPHLTIGRVGDLKGWGPVRNDLLEAADQSFGSSPISRLVLYRSILGGETARYEELAGYQLAGGE